MIYTCFFSPVKLLTARHVPVWIEKRRGEIKWHYSEPKRTKKTLEINHLYVLHVTAEYLEASEDGSIKAGMPVFNGEEFCANELKATDGVREIDRECERLMKQAA